MIEKEGCVDETESEVKGVVGAQGGRPKKLDKNQSWVKNPTKLKAVTKALRGK